MLFLQMILFRKPWSYFCNKALRALLELVIPFPVLLQGCLHALAEVLCAKAEQP